MTSAATLLPGAAITIFQAKKIITMNPSNPEGTHVAVKDRRILGVGTLEELAGWGDYQLDDTFKDLVLVPGMIEAHAHFLEGGMTLFPYVGYFDRPNPDGGISPAVKNYDDLKDILRKEDEKLTAAGDQDTPIVVQGFDPIYFQGARLNVNDLDEVSKKRPIFVLHASAHLATVNTAMLNKHGITPDTEVAGVGKFEDGKLNGELQEMPAMMLAKSGFEILAKSAGNPEALKNLGRLACNSGVTTVTDLGGQLLVQPTLLKTWQEIINKDDFPARVHIYNIPTSLGTTGNWHSLVIL